MQLGKKTPLLIILVIVVVGGALILLSSPKSPAFFQLDGRTDLEQAPAEIKKVGYEAKGEITEEDINIQYALQENEKLQEARVEIPGASPINVDDVVLTYEGEVADNGAAPGSAEAPKVTQALTKDELTADTIMLDCDSQGFTPNQITAQAGKPTTLSLTSVDDQVHVLRFEDPALNAVYLGVMPGETRAITFNAPVPGNYPFFCEVPEHKDRGEVGVMIVR